MLSRGLGNILSTPISTALQEVSSSILASSVKPRHQTGYTLDGGQYEKMILYVGSCFAGTAVIVALGWLSEVKFRRS